MVNPQMTVEEVIADVEQRGMRPIEAGEQVEIAYTGYSVTATVLKTEDSFGWFLVRQDSDYEDAPEDHRPTYKACAEYVVRKGEDLPEAPMARLARKLWGTS